ncbi:MAG: DUF4402 domain-containing protein [Flavobacterium sp.]|nr:DUF4402 domain-containing protein [Pedobacter sp.]
MLIRNYITTQRLFKLVISLLFVFCNQQITKAQQKPPRPISVTVNPVQGLIFGAFYQGVSGGTITIFSNGTRSVSGDIIQANMGFSFSPAIFEVEALPGTLISILNGSDVSLSGSNGGSMTLRLGNSNLGNSFISNALSPTTTQVTIGGILTIGNPLANPPGNYSGSFSVTFIQE